MLPFPTSLPDFMRLFPDDAACATHLEQIRWPEGFACQGAIRASREAVAAKTVRWELTG